MYPLKKNISSFGWTCEADSWKIDLGEITLKSIQDLWYVMKFKWECVSLQLESLTKYPVRMFSIGPCYDNTCSPQLQ